VRRAPFRLALLALVALAIGAVLLLVGTGAGNRRLHREIDGQLERLLHGPVSIESVSVSIDGGLQVHGNSIDVYPRGEGHSLTTRHAIAEIHVPSLVLGRFKLSRLLADGIHLEIERSTDGAWAPTPFALLAARPDTNPSRWERNLAIVRTMESVTRFLLERPVIAQTLQIRNGSVSFADAGLRDGAEATLSRVRDVAGSVVHDWFGPGAELQLSALFLDDQGTWARIEAHGLKGEGGRLQLSLAVTDLPLRALAPYAREIHPEAELSGGLSGVLSFQTHERDHGVVEADWGLRDLDGGLPVGSTPLRVDTEEARLYARLEMHPGRLRLDTLEFDGADLRIAATGSVDRPILDSSRMQLGVRIRGAGFAQVRRVAEALPEDDARPILRGLDRIREGRLLVVSGRGTTRVGRWRGIFAGEVERLPDSFVLGAEVSDVRVAIGGNDELRDVGGSVQWSGDRVGVRGARAFWKGQPLPTLDLTIDGLSHLMASQADARSMPALAVALPGAPALIDILDGPDDPDDPPFRLEDLPAFQLDVEHVLHPVLLWPLVDARVHVEGAPGGLRVVLESGTWADVPIAGELFWEEAPGRRVTAQLEASAPAADAGGGSATKPAPDDWLRSRVEVRGPRLATLPSDRAAADLRIHGSWAELGGLEARLTPEGVLRGRAALDLASADQIPVSLEFEIADARLEEVGPVFGMEPGLAKGRVQAQGWLEGSLHHDLHLMADLSGELGLRLQKGEVRQRLPLIVALAQASENWNAFGRRDVLLFDAVESQVTVDRGRLYTEALTLDGPTQLFVSGSLDVGRPVQDVDALVGVFLFPEADSALADAPLIKAFLPGSSRGLVGAYFEMEGTWDEPEVRALPIKTLAEQLPEVIKTPLRAIKSLFGSGRQRGRPATPPERRRLPGPAPEGDAVANGSGGPAEDGS